MSMPRHADHRQIRSSGLPPGSTRWCPSCFSHHAPDCPPLDQDARGIASSTGIWEGERTISQGGGPDGLRDCQGPSGDLLRARASSGTLRDSGPANFSVGRPR
jgi:hypothetical protein